MGVKCRLVEKIGRKYGVVYVWHSGDCSYCRSVLEITKEEYDSIPRYELKQRFRDKGPQCTKCSSNCPDTAEISLIDEAKWNTEDGDIHPGDMFYHMPYTDGKCHAWDNCEGCKSGKGHLHVILPDNHTWDIDSRANNCTKPEDKTHRCWVRTGDAPNITVAKDGETCAAGAGSIGTPTYHGFLRNGELVPA